MLRKHQQEINEALYSHKNNHMVLHSAIAHELDGIFLMFGLRACMRINQYMNKKYFESKNERMKVLRAHVQAKGLESLLVPLIAAVIHTSTTQTIQQVVGYLQGYLPHTGGFSRAVTAGELIALCAHPTSLYTIERHQAAPSTVKVDVWKQLYAKLMGSFSWINDTCFNPPLVAKPLEVKDNYHCGYHTISEPLILGKFTMHEGKQNYKAINCLNEIEWILDPDVLAEPEVPSKPFKSMTHRKQFIDMVAASQFIYNLLGSKPFYLGWQYDSRGRMYSHGYHVNFQAAEYKKACLSFNRFEVLT